MIAIDEKFYAKSILSRHEGGTKFYQIFRIYNQKANFYVQVNHYGTIKSGKAKAFQPSSCGQSESVARVSKNYLDNEVNNLARAKQKRGYGEFTHYYGFETYKKEELVAWVKNNMPKEYVLSILNLINLEGRRRIVDEPLVREKFLGKKADMVFFDELAEFCESKPAMQIDNAIVVEEQSPLWATW